MIGSVVIFYGDARFRHNSPGHATGLGSGYFIQNLAAYSRVYVLRTPEFRTSIVCSGCHHEARLVAAGSSRDFLADEVRFLDLLD